MNCQSFDEVGIDLARSLPMEASTREAVLAHCESCEICAGRLAQEQLLTGGLQVLATEMKSAIAPDHIQQNLVAAFRQQRLAPQIAQSNVTWRYLAIAAAIVVAVGLGVAGYKMRQAPPVDSQVSATPPTQTAPPVISTPPVKGPSVTTVREHKPRSLSANKQPKKRSRPAASAQSTFVTVVVGSVTDPEPSEVVSTFMAVGYNSPANMQEGAQVVRVELPRYAMARFGLPVNMERYDERVKADVWLGTDGVARAIRFVQ